MASGVFPSHPTLFSEPGVSPPPPILLDWLSYKPQTPSSLCLPTARVPGAHCHARVWGSNLILMPAQQALLIEQSSPQPTSPLPTRSLIPFLMSLSGSSASGCTGAHVHTLTLPGYDQVAGIADPSCCLPPVVQPRALLILVYQECRSR